MKQFGNISRLLGVLVSIGGRPVQKYVFRNIFRRLQLRWWNEQIEGGCSKGKSEMPLCLLVSTLATDRVILLFDLSERDESDVASMGGR